MREACNRYAVEERASSLFHDKVLPLYAGYPGFARIKENFPRMQYYLNLLAQESTIRPGLSLVDLGGGLSPWSALLSALGLRVTLIDDFGGGGGVECGTEEICQTLLSRFQAAGVSICSQDLLMTRLPFADESVDVMTCFQCFEHFQHSSLHLWGEIRRILRPDGIILVATPNSVNLRKRLSVLLGNTNLCSLDEWYYAGNPFRGHVREPTLEELKTLLGWNGFAVQATAGRNFLGQDSLTAGKYFSAKSVLLMWQLLDRLLRLAPTLCSDIHVVGRKTSLPLASTTRGCTA